MNFLVELFYDLFESGSEDGEIKIWSVSEWTNLRTWKAHNSSIVSLVLLSKQKYIASLSQQGQEIKIWAYSQGSLVKTLSSQNTIISMVVLRNGDIVSASDKGYIDIWEVETGLLKKRLFYGLRIIWCLALDLKGRLAVGMGNGEIRILNYLN